MGPTENHAQGHPLTPSSWWGYMHVLNGTCFLCHWLSLVSLALLVLLVFVDCVGFHWFSLVSLFHWSSLVSMLSLLFTGFTCLIGFIGSPWGFQWVFPWATPWGPPLRGKFHFARPCRSLPVRCTVLCTVPCTVLLPF